MIDVSYGYDPADNKHWARVERDGVAYKLYWAYDWSGLAEEWKAAVDARIMEELSNEL